MVADYATDFDEWLVETFTRVGPFTSLIVLVEIGETTVGLLRSSYLHIIGDETRWPEILEMFAGAGAAWDGAAFYQADRAGLVRDPVARHRLQSLLRHLEGDRSLLKHADFFDRRGLRLKIEEIAPS
ncbi:MAG TPA: hypothetical protein VNW53_03095 [Phenylobacterium sp.]|jgi:hypothetical protein|uniref:hypothetical protein n=1 Tax=Phenylobacterium sp. TaxID=1871053 RepID=UPI002B6962DA|nr:hypothetical protein [Phenylobacterium sp.]HXA37961.1 hypothetical protein [Phenylobacterium sp.]